MEVGMKPRLICVAKLSQENVRVFEKPGCEDGSAAYCFAPSDGGSDAIYLSLKNRTWSDVVSQLMHESMESQMHRLGFGYESSQTPRYESGGFMFMFDHKRFSEMTDWSAVFICRCMDEVKKAFDRVNVDRKTVSTAR